MDDSSWHALLQCIYGILLALNIALDSSEAKTETIDVPVDWDRFCPFTDVCNHTASQEITLAPGQTPCCEECSCHPDCGLERNCCRYSMDRYRLDERYHTSCTRLDISSLKSSRTDGYNVVDQCSNSTSCSTIAAAPWGSIYPVYSNKSKMIYINDACAACNGETDVEKWDVEISCPMASTFDSHISDGLETVLHNRSGGNCKLKFFPPTHANVRRHICQQMARDQSMDCLDNYSDTHNHFAALCRGLNATFTYLNRIRYNNIFCYLCILESDSSFFIKYIEKYPICKINERSRDTGTLTRLLFTSDTLQLLNDKRTTKDAGETECNDDRFIERTNGRCRNIRCPEGQLKIGLKCIHVSHDWIAGPFQALIRLDPIGPNDMIPLDFIETLSEEKTKMFKNRLKPWDHKEFYSSVNNGSFVDFLMIWVWRNKAHFDPDKFLAAFHTDLKTTWTTKVNDKTIRMKANFNKYYKYRQVSKYTGNFNYEMLNSIELDRLRRSDGTDILRSVKSDVTISRQGDALLSKFYFCKQVDLEPEEYVDHVDRVYFNVTGAFLEEAEFRRTRGLNGESIISVCVEDFGENFWEQRNTASAYVMWITSAVVICSFITGHLL